MKLLIIISVGFDVTDQRLISFLQSSDIHRLQESLWLSMEGSIVQYSYTVWGIYEVSQAD
jgi:hypothetical protein